MLLILSWRIRHDKSVFKSSLTKSKQTISLPATHWGFKTFQNTLETNVKVVRKTTWMKRNVNEMLNDSSFLLYTHTQTYKNEGAKPQQQKQQQRHSSSKQLKPSLSRNHRSATSAKLSAVTQTHQRKKPTRTKRGQRYELRAFHLNSTKTKCPVLKDALHKVNLIITPKCSTTHIL